VLYFIEQTRRLITMNTVIVRAENSQVSETHLKEGLRLLAHLLAKHITEAEELSCVDYAQSVREGQTSYATS